MNHDLLLLVKVGGFRGM